MSSHHIVKENQEPALLVMQASSMAAEDLGQLLEWSPTIITDPTSYADLTAQGIKVDLLFSNTAVQLSQEHIQVISYPGDFLTAAFQYLIAHNFKAVNIITDSFPEALILSFADQSNIVILGNGKRIITAKSGYEKWKPKGEHIHILSPVEGLEVRGLTNVSSVTADVDAAYVTVADGFYGVQFSKPIFCLLAEEI